MQKSPGVSDASVMAICPAATPILTGKLPIGGAAAQNTRPEIARRPVVQATGDLLGHYLFQKRECAIRRKVGHGVIVSRFGQRNMIYTFLLTFKTKKSHFF